MRAKLNSLTFKAYTTGTLTINRSLSKIRLFKISPLTTGFLVKLTSVQKVVNKVLSNKKMLIRQPSKPELSKSNHLSQEFKNKVLSLRSLAFISIYAVACSSLPAKAAEQNTTTIEPAPYISTIAEDSIQRLIWLLDKHNGMSATFTQITTDKEGNSLQELSGDLSVKRPNKLYWKTSPPYEQQVISDGKTIWVYDEDLAQVTIRNMEPNLSETPALLFSGSADKIQTDFEVQQTEGELNFDYKIETFELVPIDSSQLFEKLTLTYQNEKIEQLIIDDVSGQITTIKLLNVNTTAPNDALFSFITPDDADVIDGR